MGKFSELKRRAEKCPIKRFKPFIGKANTQATLCADTGIEIIGWSGFDASDLNAKSHRVELARFIAAADPETILDLLAELEAKESKIVELRDLGINAVTAEERTSTAWQKRAEAAEAKLATPVRLPVPYSENPWMSPDPDGTWFDKGDVKESIHAAGFTVGDE
ncbi:ead/Ea22-like family protein [Serratia quinivorans]|uniref:ead/Ea22-like family protein n=1 Tax=Serratia quinivorans TaxID=137545 RepID=UPI0034C6472D